MSASKRVRTLVEMDLRNIRTGRWDCGSIDSLEQEIETKEESLIQLRKRLKELRTEEAELLQWLIDNPE